MYLTKYLAGRLDSPRLGQVVEVTESAAGRFPAHMCMLFVIFQRDSFIQRRSEVRPTNFYTFPNSATVKRKSSNCRVQSISPDESSFSLIGSRHVLHLSLP